VDCLVVQAHLELDWAAFGRPYLQLLVDFVDFVGSENLAVLL
jgi:hypothetical protein